MGHFHPARSISLRALLALAALAPLPSSASAQRVLGTPDSLTARVDSIFRAFDRTDSPGCAVGVYRDGRIVYARGYGMASLEMGVPITPRTVLGIASITKQFTATAVLLLAQAGQLSLDEPVSRYFPEMPAYASGITIRQLLNHTAGLRDGWVLYAISGRHPTTAEEALRFITRSTATDFPPGTRFEYSNTGFKLASELVSRVSGQGLATFLKERVFEPLGMADTRLPQDRWIIIPGRAQAYTPAGFYAPRGAGLRLAMAPFSGTDLGGAGGIYSTIEDFARWDRNWDSASVGGPALVESLIARGPLPSGSEWGYGLGMFVGTYRGLRTVWHNGWADGYKSTYRRFPDQKLSVACFCNLMSLDAEELGLKVASVYLETQYVSPPIKPDSSSDWRAALLATPAASLSLEELRRYEGLWYNPERGQLRRTRLVGNSLTYVFLALRHEGVPLVPLGASRFLFRDPWAEGAAREVVFETDGTGTLAGMQSSSGATTIAWRQVDAVRLNALQLAEYAGEYHNEELETTYTLAVDTSYEASGRGGAPGLAVRIGGRLFGTLEPTWRDGFALVEEIEPGLSLLFEFARDGGGSVAGLAIQRGGKEAIRFARRQVAPLRDPASRQ